MNLDDVSNYLQFDPADMLHDITTLPDQLETGWRDASRQVQQFQPFPEIRQVLITGMGGSAIAGDLAAAYVQPFCKVPVQVLREYDLPGWVDARHTLVIASSHSGGTEETLSVVSQVRKIGAHLIGVTTGGQLKQICLESWCAGTHLRAQRSTPRGGRFLLRECVGNPRPSSPDSRPEQRN